MFIHVNEFKYMYHYPLLLTMDLGLVRELGKGFGNFTFSQVTLIISV